MSHSMAFLTNAIISDPYLWKLSTRVDYNHVIRNVRLQTGRSKLLSANFDGRKLPEVNLPVIIVIVKEVHGASTFLSQRTVFFTARLRWNGRCPTYCYLLPRTRFTEITDSDQSSVIVDVCLTGEKSAMGSRESERTQDDYYSGEGTGLPDRFHQFTLINNENYLCVTCLIVKKLVKASGCKEVLK